MGKNPNQRAATQCLFCLVWGSFVSFHLSSVPSHVRPSTVCVNNSVPLQVVHHDEGFPAQRAAVRPLPTVRSLMDPQTALLREPLPTLSAAKRFLACVSAVMNAEVGRALEVLAADGAPERPLSLVALLMELELVQAAEWLPALGADVASWHAGERSVWSVMGEAAWRESVLWRSCSRSIPRRSLPLWVFIQLPQMCSIRRVSLWVNLFLLPVLLQQSTLRSGLETRHLRNVFLILTVIDPITRPLRGQLLDSSWLAGVWTHMSIRMVWKCLGIFLYHTGKVRKTCVYVLTFNYGGPELILPLIYGEVSTELTLLSSAVLTSIPTESWLILLLFRLDSELKAADVSWKLTRVIQLTKLWSFLPGDLWGV